MWRVVGRRKGVKVFCGGHLIDGDYLEGLVIEVRLVLKIDFEKRRMN
jgi:hypothetical protein